MQLAGSMLIVGVIVIAAVTASAQQVDLQLKLEPGRVYKTTTAIEQQTNVSGGVVPLGIQQTTRIGTSQKVLKRHDNGNYDIAVTYDWVVLKIPHPARDIDYQVDYDSRKQPQEDTLHPAAVHLVGLAGTSFEMTITPRAKVIEFRGVDAMLDRMIDGMHAAFRRDRDAMKQLLQPHFGEEALKDWIENATPLPEGPVKIGDAWQRKTPIPGIASELTTQYTLASVEGGVARIEARSSITPDAEAKPVLIFGSDVKQELRGTQKGFLLVDTASGWVNYSEMNQDMKGERIMQNLDSGRETRRPMTIKSKIVITHE